MPEPNADHRESGGLLPIGAIVARMQRAYPDVTHSSLRFLEREGLVTPTRTPGGHRLYAPADVDRIGHIKEWQRQRLSLEEIRRRLADLDRLPAPAALADAFLQQALAGHLAAAYQSIIAADDVGMPLVRLFGDVLQPALFAVGKRWEHGDVLVAQEKEISELVRDLIAELSVRHSRTSPDGPTIVAACVEGERHQLGLRMICGILRASGCAVYYLGADVAPRFLLESARLHHPAAVLLSAKLDPNLPAIRDAIGTLGDGLSPEQMPRLVVGGEVALRHSDTIRSWGATPIPSERLDEIIETISAMLAPAAGDEAGR